MTPTAVYALPDGGQVSAGAATIQRAGSAMTVSQSSDRASINWQSFGIGQGESVRFMQPGPASVVLNRVVGQDPSLILGSLSANGQVFLVNPNGVLFGPGAQVNVGGIVASTLNLSDADFLSGRLAFSRGSRAGEVVNQGSISAAGGGSVAFLGPQVRNEGVIHAHLGTVLLAAGERATLSFAGNRLVAFAVDAGALDALAENRNLIQADGGQVVLTARAADALARSVVNNSGTLQARTISERNGVIRLEGVGGVVSMSGTLDAAGRHAGERGGTIQVLGERVGLIDRASVDASGSSGGGTVLVGGDYQGTNPAVKNSAVTHVGSDVSIKADALTNGDGGKVIIWADDTTRFYGSISARGGAQGGDGGFVETSGKGRLDFQGVVDTRAPKGATGTLLLDPTDITISTAASTSTLSFGGGAYADTTTTPSNLNVTTLAGQLGLSNVIVTTASPLGGNGDITVNNWIDYTSANSLTLTANRNITIVAGSGGINNAGTGAVTLTGGGTGSIAVNGSITTGGGNIAITSGSGGVSLAASKSLNAGSGQIAINAGGGAANFTSGTLETSNATASAIGVTNATTLTLGNVALTGGGTLSVSHSGAGTQTAGTTISGTGGLTKAGAGTLTLSQANTYTGATNISAGTLALGTADERISNSSALTVAGGATFDLATLSETIGSLSGAGTVTKSGGGTDTLTVGGDNTSTTFSGVIQNAAGTLNLAKWGAGTLTLEGTNTYTGTTTVGNGGLTLGGPSGSATSSASLIVGAGAKVTLDNTAANNNDRFAGILAMHGGEFVVLGNAAANTTETLGALNLVVGYSTVTLTPNAASNTQVTFASLARAAGTTALFRGTSLGANTVASQTANSSNIVFTAAPALTGGGGNSGTTTVSIVAGAIGAGGASGSTSPGTDFITYNPPTGSVNGLRPLLGTEYAAAPAANVNLRLTADTSSNANFSLNSLLLSGGVTYDYDQAAGTNTITLGGAGLSGNVLSIGGTNTIQPTLNPGGNLAFGTTEAKIFAVSDLILGSQAPVAGSGGLSKSGAGVLLENRSVLIGGGLTVNTGTLRSGIASAFASQVLTVRAAGTFDLDGFNNSFTTLSLNSGGASGAAVTTGAGTLTLGAGGVALNVTGSGETGASISGNLALTAAAANATRTFNVANGGAADDLSVAATILNCVLPCTGVGSLTKTGAGTLALSGANTYTGATTINAGMLSANTLANGGVASSIGQSTNAAANLVLGNGTLQYTGGTVSSDRNFTLTAGTTGTVDVSGAAANLTISGASTVTTGALTKSGSGTLTLSGANGYTGTTTVTAGTLAEGVNNALSSGAVSVSGGTFDMGTFTDTVGAVTLTNGSIAGSAGILTGASYAVQNGSISAILAGAGNLTKTTAGTVTLTGANTYTGITTINAGVLSANSLANGGVASSIGQSTNAAANLVLGGGTLHYAGASVATDRNFTLTGGTTNSVDVASATTDLTISGGSTGTTGALTKLGSGTLILSGTNLNTGATTIREGTLQIGNGGATGALGTGAVTNIGTLEFNRNNALPVANVISSFGTVTQAGSGTTTLSGANTYSGGTTIRAGTLAGSTSASAFGTGTITIGDSGGLANATLSGGSALTFANAISVASGNSGIATITDTANATFSGAVTLNGHDVTLSRAGNSLVLSGGITGAGNLALTTSGTGTLTLSTNSVNHTGTITNSGAGTGAATISTSVGANVTGVTQNSTSSALTLSGGVVMSGVGTTKTLTNASGTALLTVSTTATSGTGNLVLDNDSATAAGITVSAGVNHTGTLTNAGSGTGGVTVSGVVGANVSSVAQDSATSMLLLSGANTYTGATNINAGTLRVAGGNGIGNSSAVVLADVSSATLDLNGTNETIGSLAGAGVTGGNVTLGAGTLTTGGNNTSTTYSGVVSGTGGIVKAGTGTFTLTGTNIYSGSTTIAAGIVDANASAALGNGSATNTLVLIGGRLTASGTITSPSARGVTLTSGNILDTNGNSVDIAGVISGAGALTKNGAGTLALSGANTYAGATTVSAGTLAITNNTGLGTIAGGVTVASGATLDLRGVTVGAEALTVNGGTIATSIGTSSHSGTVALTANSTVSVDGTQLTLSGIMSGGFGIDKQGAGTLILSGANAYSGATSINAGTLRVAGGNGIGNSSAVVLADVSGATLDLNGTSETIGSLSGGGATGGNVTLGAGTLTTGGNNAGTTYSGIVSGTGGITKQGSGTFALTGTNTYSGATTVSAGVLNIQNATATGTTAGGVTVASGAALEVQGGIAVGAEALTLGGTGFGGNGALRNIGGSNSWGGSITLTSASRIQVDAGSLALNGTIDGAFALDLTGAGSLTFGAAVGGATALASLTSAVNLSVNGGQVRTSGSQAYSGATTFGGATTLQTTAGGDISATGAVTATAGMLTINTGAGDATLNNAANDFGTVQVTSADAVTLVDANALAVGTSSAGTLSARTLSGNLTLGGSVTASGSGDSIVLAAAGDFLNPGANALNPGPGRFLVWSTNPANDDRGGLAYGFKQYNATFGVTAPAQATGNGLLYAVAPTITPALAGTVSRGYDGTLTATLAGVNYASSGAIDGDTVTLNDPASGTYDTRHVGSGKTVSVTGISIATATNGAATVYGYGLSSTSANAAIGTIIAAPLTVTAQADSRGYNGTTSSAVAPLLTGTQFDAVGTAATQSYDNKNVGTTHVLSASGLVMNDGNSGNNYAITYVPSAATGTITVAPLTVTAQIDSRVYNGTTSSAAAPLLTGTQFDAVGTAATQSYDNRNVGTTHVLSASGLVMNDGNSGNNYSITYVPSAATGVIAAAPLTVTAQTDSRVYNGTTNSGVAPVLTGTQYDAVGTAATQSYDNKHVGTTHVLSASGLVMNDGNSGNNYAITYVPSAATGVITAAPLTVSAQSDSRVYNGTTSSGVAPVLTGTQYDAVGTAATQSYDNKNAGTTHVLSASGLVMNDGNSGNNYAITYVPSAATGVITAAALTMTAATNTKIYDGTVSAAATPTVSGLQAGDSVTGAQIYADKHAGSGKTLSVSSYIVNDGNSGNNYSVSTINNTTGVITTAPLAVTAQSDSRGYNGTTSSGVAPVLTGTQYDAVGAAATQSYDNKNVGSTHVLSASGLVMNDGNSGNNYAITYVPSAATGVITAAPLTIAADDKSRLQGAPNPLFTASYSGFVAGEGPADLSGSLLLGTPAVVASPPGAYAITAGGHASSNYVITYVDGVLTVTATGGGGGGGGGDGRLSDAISFASQQGDQAGGAPTPAGAGAAQAALSAARVYQVEGTGIRMPPGLQR